MSKRRKENWAFCDSNAAISFYDSFGFESRWLSACSLERKVLIEYVALAVDGMVINPLAAIRLKRAVFGFSFSIISVSETEFEISVYQEIFL